MSECDNYSNDIFGGNPYKITVGGIQYPSKIEVSLCYGIPGILRYPEEVTYVPMKTSKVNIHTNSFGEILSCKCFECKNEVKPWDRYCSNCGAKLQTGNIVTVSTIDEEKSE